MRLIIVLVALTALAACGSKETEQTQRASFGKVLPGSASDGMLPFDTASSSPPLAPATYESIEDEATPDAPRPKAPRPSATADIAPQAEPT